jgi:hypothetical protein
MILARDRVRKRESVEDAMAIVPPYLLERPSEPVLLAHWLLAAETGTHPDAHLPCRPVSGCERCIEKGDEFVERWRESAVEHQAHPDATQEARDLIDLWYLLGSSRIDVGFPLPMFDPAVVPRAQS